MTYHSLSESTLTDEERVTEAERIIKILTQNVNFNIMQQNERNLIQKICKYGSVSVKQLFWLRDIKDKYL